MKWTDYLDRGKFLAGTDARVSVGYKRYDLAGNEMVGVREYAGI